jgi:PAS domain S-box-containing protein
LKLSLRAKFLTVSVVVQALLVSLLIWNSLRLMDDAVRRNADRVAHEYAVTLNLTLGPYASSGRIAAMQTYLAEMLADQSDTFVRYIVVVDPYGVPLLKAGTPPADPEEAFNRPGVAPTPGLRTRMDGSMLRARAPLLLNDNQTGALHFGLSTDDLAAARANVLTQGSGIAVAGFLLGLVLLYLLTRGMGQRLNALTLQSERLARGDFEALAPEQGNDELQVFAHSLNSMSVALRTRIAQLMQAEQRLAESEARFETLFETAPVPLTVTDGDGKLLACNLALTRVFGHDPAKVLGKRSSEFNFWASAGERERVWELFRRDGIVTGEIAKVQLAGGRAGDVAIWSSSLSLDGDSAIIWALMDMTDELDAKRALGELNASLETRVQERSAALSEALETLKRTQSDLIAAEKMAALGSLVAGVAHELNTPIGNSLLAATTLSHRVLECRRQIDAGGMKRSTIGQHLDDVALACSLIESSLHKAAHLIASFKRVAVDQTTDQRRVFDLHAVLDDTLAAYRPRLHLAQCETRLEVAGQFTCDSFPGSLSQVLSNLMNNAFVHAFDSGRGGIIAISVGAAALPGFVELRFSDNGKGMDEAVLRRVFDPFFTTKMAQGGSGLGMNIVYNIVTGVLGGRITIESALDQGTTVSIVIPQIAPARL